jgi:hypothetical protein
MIAVANCQPCKVVVRGNRYTENSECVCVQLIFRIFNIRLSVVEWEDNDCWV